MSPANNPVASASGGLNSLPARLLNMVWRQPGSMTSTDQGLGQGRQSTAAKVQIVADSRPRFVNELTPLLRRRLRTITIVLTIEKILLLVGTLSFPLLGLRLTLIVIMFSWHLVLRSPIAITLRQLRWIELVILAGFFTQATSMPDALILERAPLGDFATATMDCHFVIGAWAVFIMMYGVLIPNTWRRAALIIIPFSCIPSINFYLLGLYEPMVRKAFDSVHHGTPIPLMLLGCAGGIYGAHTIYSIRQGTFKAKQLGRYRLGAKLGAGGMGEVYRAHHNLLKRPCAIKLIRPGLDADPAAVVRFEREVQATSQLSHPGNTIEIYDYGRTDEGVFYYVMELLSGMSLQDAVTRFGPMTPARAAYLLRQVCGALGEAHALGMIHRDIKPANIFAARLGGEDDVAKLLDFGMVKSTSDNTELGLTQNDQLTMGSPYYMSPEQATSNPNLDFRTDIYSLGAVGYFLVTGQPPFAGKSQLEVVAALTRDPVKPPSALNPGLGPDFEAILLKCLEKRAEDRFSDVGALRQALEACAFDEPWSPAKAGQ